jgi:hypothetical protein
MHFNTQAIQTTAMDSSVFPGECPGPFRQATGKITFTETPTERPSSPALQAKNRRLTSTFKMARYRIISLRLSGKKSYFFLRALLDK